MKTISVHQPHATLLILGLKQYETRNYPISHRGPLAIHATKSREYEHLFYDPNIQPWLEAWGYRSPNDLAYGAVLGIEDLLNVYRAEECSPNCYERAWGDWTPGRFVWKVDLAERFKEPVIVPGQQGLWEWEPALRQAQDEVGMR